MPHPDLSIPLLPDADDLPLPHPHYTWPEAGPSSPRAAGFLGNVDAEYAYTHRRRPPGETTGDARGRIRERQGNGQAGEDERDGDGDTGTDPSKAGLFGAKAIAAMTGAMATSLLSASFLQSFCDGWVD